LGPLHSLYTVSDACAQIPQDSGCDPP